ncbi:MAG: radical SAM protein, partial [Candidatus Poseidoniaceae archaeon]|nr:radical SAM protein [Candidatus Poseidoniaceae archaeon]
MNQQQTKIGKDGAKLAVIAPSLLCNYDCSYCRIKSKTRAPGEHELSKWCDALVGIGAPITHIGGGEPTVLKGFENFALDYPSRLRMTTNLWRHPSLWHEDFWQKFEYLTLSFHPEHTTFEEFRDKARYLTDKFTGQDIAPRMTCTIVAHPKFLDTLERWVTELCAVGVDARGQYFNAPAGSELRTYT